MNRICDLNGKQVEAIIIYHKAFQAEPTPCPTCVSHCCVGCEPNRGYLDDKFEETKAKYGFTEAGSLDVYRRYSTGEAPNDIEQGFYVPGKGCRIPFTERSRICVGFTCGKMDVKQQRAGNNLHSLLW